MLSVESWFEGSTITLFVVDLEVTHHVSFTVKEYVLLNDPIIWWIKLPLYGEMLQQNLFWRLKLFIKSIININILNKTAVYCFQVFSVGLILIGLWFKQINELKKDNRNDELLSESPDPPWHVFIRKLFSSTVTEDMMNWVYFFWHQIVHYY